MSESLAPREHFPVLAETTYLNAAAVSLMPVPVQEVTAEFDAGIAGRGTVGLDDAAEARVYDDSRKAIADLFGTNPANIAIMTSATEALGQIAWWLYPGSKSNVVTADIEFPSVTYPWLQIAKRTGVEVRLISALENPAGFGFEAVVEAVDSDTAAICLSEVQYATGHRLDLERLTKLAREHSAQLVVDATQSAGVVPVDLDDSEVDIYIASSYKWLCGGLGSAFCYMSERTWERFIPTLTGAKSTEHPYYFDATRIQLANAARRMEYSTTAYGAGIAMGESVRYLRDIGVERIFRHNIELTSQLRHGLSGLNAQFLTPEADADRAGVLTAVFPGHDSTQLAAALSEEGIIVSPRLGGIRFSPHFYNSSADIEHALDVLALIVR